MFLMMHPSIATIASSTPTIDVASVIPKAEEALLGKHNGITPSLEYLVLADGSVALTHVVQIQNEDEFTWYEAFIDAHSGEIVSVTDFVADASVSRIVIVTSR